MELKSTMTIEPTIAPIRPTTKRYVILGLLVALSIAKSFQWTCVASATDIMTVHWNVDNIAINWNTILLMFTFLILALPVSFIVEHIGLRNSVIIGALGTTLGTIIKCFSCGQDGFWINMLGHLMVGFAEPFFFSINTRVASVWFPEHETSRATAISLAGDQIGVATGFILPSYLLGSDPYDSETIRRGMAQMYGGTTLLLVITSITILFFFSEQPRQAPSIARYKQIQVEEMKGQAKKSFGIQLNEQLLVLANFLANKNFLILIFGFGLNEGANYTIHTLLNQMVVQMLGPGYAHVVGLAGFILIISGVFGSIFCGYILDTFHRFKATTIVIYIATIVSTVLLAACLHTNSLAILYLSMIPLGFFNMGFTSIGFEYAVEITYPESEQLSSTVMNVASQIFGIPISLWGSSIVDEHGNFAVCLFFFIILVIGFITTCFENGKLRRQESIQN